MKNLDLLTIADSIAHEGIKARKDVKQANIVIPKLPINDIQEFNKAIGYPKHPATLIRSPILDYQIEYMNMIFKNHRVILNKSRKIGATETALRAICLNCYNGVYNGHNVIIVAGNRQDEANVILERFNDLFVDGWRPDKKTHITYEELVKSHKADRLILHSGVDIRTIPANPRALRAQANVKCVFFTEAAHINSLNDSKVWAAVRPIIANDDMADIIVESTPAGHRGFFYDEYHKPNNGFEKKTFDYTYALDKLITSEFIERERRSLPKWLFSQEYEAKFVAGGTTAVDISKLMRTDRPMLDL